MLNQDANTNEILLQYSWLNCEIHQKVFIYMFIFNLKVDIQTIIWL